MIAAAPLTFPGGRAVAGWWRQLAPLHPQAIWVAHLLLHRVEALVRSTHSWRLDPFLRPIVEALAQVDNLSLAHLDTRLHLGRQLVLQVVHTLRAQGLATVDALGRWCLTDAGRTASSQGHYAADRCERTTFYFLHGSSIERGLEESAPRFLSIGQRPRPSWPAGGEWSFDVAQLDHCIGQPADWKARRAFPAEIVEVLGTQSATRADAHDSIPEWQRTIIDYPERLSAVLILKPTSGGGEQCLAFEFQQQGWHLYADQPVFTLGADWSVVLPELLQDVPFELWRQSWQAWLASRGLANVDVSSCRLERYACRLRILTSAALLDRIRAVVRPAVQSDIWLLAGEGRFRAAAHVELVVA